MTLENKTIHFKKKLSWKLQGWGWKSGIEKVRVGWVGQEHLPGSSMGTTEPWDHWRGCFLCTSPFLPPLPPLPKSGQFGVSPTFAVHLHLEIQYKLRRAGLYSSLTLWFLPWPLGSGPLGNSYAVLKVGDYWSSAILDILGHKGF